MVGFTFDLKVHVGGCFVEDPTQQYVGGFVHALIEIDPDKLSFFEIRDLCHLVDDPKEHSRYRYLLPEDDGVGGDGEVDEIDLESDYDEVVLEEEEDVENVEVGARVEEQDVEVSARVEEQNVEGDDDDDWLYEGLEGEDFGDNIFATPKLAL
nr:hypothetical protein CFP56_14748 [Quercus suber]